MNVVLHVISRVFFFSKKIAKYGFQFQFELSNSIYDAIIFIRKNQKMEFIFQCEAELSLRKDSSMVLGLDLRGEKS